jgi:uncharacterized protein
MSNLPKIKALFEAYANKNLAAVSAVMAEDIVWRIPGHHPLSSEKHGIKEVLAFFDQLAKANFQASRWWSRSREITWRTITEAGAL